jgi:hypothetical protein
MRDDFAFHIVPAHSTRRAKQPHSHLDYIFSTEKWSGTAWCEVTHQRRSLTAEFSEGEINRIYFRALRTGFAFSCRLAAKQ